MTAAAFFSSRSASAEKAYGSQVLHAAHSSVCQRVPQAVSELSDDELGVDYFTAQSELARERLVFG